MLTSHIIRVAVEAALAEDAPTATSPARPPSPRTKTGSAHLTAREKTA